MTLTEISRGIAARAGAFSALIALGLLAACATAEPMMSDADAMAVSEENTVYELRIYHPQPGKFEALNARFRDHTLRYFDRHGMTNVGYFTPLDPSDERLVYLLSYPSREARDASWAAFAADPDWTAARDASQVDGPLVESVDATFLEIADYSPALADYEAAAGPRLFELRTYTSPPGKLDELHARFRDHTLAIFENHGMSNVLYFAVMDDQEMADTQLIYLIAHADQAARDASWAGFIADPEWAAVAEESQRDGPLTVQGGVQGVLLEPTDYSPMK